MVKVPVEIERIARELLSLGVRYSESLSISAWRARGWPEDPQTFKMIDACIALIEGFELNRK